MINPNEEIRITVTTYVSQFVCGVSKYYNTNFYVFQGSFKKMYLNKYAEEYHQSALNPFKVRKL